MLGLACLAQSIGQTRPAPYTHSMRLTVLVEGHVIAFLINYSQGGEKVYFHVESNRRNARGYSPVGESGAPIVLSNRVYSMKLGLFGSSSDQQ
jgi:hypothetical protein